MTSNAKIMLRKKPNKQGQYPLAIRITKNRQSNYMYIGHYIDLKYWDKKNKIVYMKANELPIINFLQAPDVQFVIPVYQRNYDWTNNECKNF